MEDQQIVTKPEENEAYPTAFNSDQGFLITSVEDAYRVAGFALKAGWAPKGIDTRESIVIAWQFGSELGLGKMASLQNLAIINGRPSLWGDVMLGLVMATGLVEDRQEWWEIDSEPLKDSRGNARKPRADEVKNPSCTAFFQIKRKGIPTPIVQSFSMADAIAAGYDKKDGPWKTATSRMIQMRARGFGLRDAFPDTLKGVMTREEAMDIPEHQGFNNAKVVGPIIPPPTTVAPPKLTDGNPPAEPAPKKEKKAEPAKEATNPPVAAAPSSTVTTPAATQPAKETPPASTEASDPCAPLLEKIRAAQKSYDFTDEDTVAYAKDKGILSPRNRMPLTDLSENILAMIVAQLAGLIDKFSQPGSDAP